MPRKLRVTDFPRCVDFYRFRIVPGKKTPLEVEDSGYNSFSAPLDLVEATSPDFISEFFDGLTIADIVLINNQPDLRDNPERTLEAKVRLAKVMPQVMLFDGRLYSKSVENGSSIKYVEGIIGTEGYIVGELAGWRYAREIGFRLTQPSFNRLIQGKGKNLKLRNFKLVHPPLLDYFKPIRKKNQKMSMQGSSLNRPVFMLPEIREALEKADLTKL